MPIDGAVAVGVATREGTTEMRTSRSALSVILVSAAGVNLFGVGSATGGAGAPTTVRASVSLTGAQANGRSRVDAISPDGRFVLFDSWASNLVRGDTNGVRDVFLRDQTVGRTYRVSVGPGGRQANGPSRGVAVSGDGRFVLFTSEATNLTNQPDRNSNVDVFVRNRLRAKTFRVSVRPGGGQFYDSRYGGLEAAGISDNGRWVAFGEAVSHGQGCCNAMRTLIRDRTTHTTRWVRYFGAWTRPHALSPNGRWLTVDLTDYHFYIQTYAVRDLSTGRTTTLDTQYLYSTGVAVTPDARYLAYDEARYDLDGSNVVRWSTATSRKLRLITHRAYWHTPVGISTDGRAIAFTSNDPTLVPNDTNGAADLFRYDATTSTITRLDLTSTGAQITRGLTQETNGPTGVTGGAVLSTDGRWAAFTSTDARVVPGDTNHAADVFVRGPLRAASTGR